MNEQNKETNDSFDELCVCVLRKWKSCVELYVRETGQIREGVCVVWEMKG